MERSESHYDSIVVGGGMAGIVAARDLCHAGLSTLLLEGRDRLGGRTNTVDFAGLRIESGGTYFDLEREPDMVAEFARYNLQTRYTKDEVAYRTLLNGKVYTGAFPFEQVDDLIRVVYHAIHDSHRINWGGADWAEGLEDLDIPFREWLEKVGDLPKETWEYVNAWVTIYAGNDSSKVSALQILGPYIAAYGNSPWAWYSGVSFEVDGGNDKYRNAVVDDSPGLTVKLESPVVKVEQGEDLLRFTTRSGEVFTADDAVWATPLNTWSAVEFQPPLSAAKTEAAEVKHIGKQEKVWMRGRNVPPGVYGISYESPFKMLLHHQTLDSGETVFFAMTEHTEIDVNDKDAIEAAFRQIVPEAEILEIFHESWIESEFSNGTWIVGGPGFLSKYFAQLGVAEGRLHFAGADVDTEFPSMMAGAVHSGKVAAAEVVEARNSR